MANRLKLTIHKLENGESRRFPGGVEDLIAWASRIANGEASEVLVEVSDGKQDLYELSRVLHAVAHISEIAYFVGPDRKAIARVLVENALDEVPSGLVRVCGECGVLWKQKMREKTDMTTCHDCGAANDVTRASVRAARLLTGAACATGEAARAENP